jgi:hypothetical protein
MTYQTLGEISGAIIVPAAWWLVARWRRQRKAVAALAEMKATMRSESSDRELAPGESSDKPREDLGASDWGPPAKERSDAALVPGSLTPSTTAGGDPSTRYPRDPLAGQRPDAKAWGAPTGRGPGPSHQNWRIIAVCVACSVLAAGMTAGVFLLAGSRGDSSSAAIALTDSPTPLPTATETPRLQLTAIESQGTAELYLRRETRWYTGGTITDVGTCTEKEYNSTTNEYVVVCQFRFRYDVQPTPRQESTGPVIVPIESAGFESTIAVNAATGVARITR